jgi:uncharacterized protein YbjT (DUF2867 family)
VRIAVAGASGFVGRALVSALTGAGHDVVALARRTPQLPGAEGRAVDVADTDSVREALTGCDAAYYLVHSLTATDFRGRDLHLAQSFGRASGTAGLQRIVYLGGLGDDPSSEHLASRQEVGVALAAAGVPVVELRAAVVLGAGSISFEMLRYLTERLPFMVCPRWVRTAIQPIAAADVIRYLVGALVVEPGTYEIGGTDVTTYRDMIAAYAGARGLRRRRIVDVPYLTPRLSAYWLDLVTPVDRRVSHALIESLVSEVVVRDPARTDRAFGIRPVGMADALVAALKDQAGMLDRDVLAGESGLRDGVYTMRVAVPLPAGAAAAVDADLDRIGGSYGWYGVPLAWRVRAALGRLAGEQWRLGRTGEVRQGTEVDWWVVARRAPNLLVLRTDRWVFGEAWLGYHVDDGELVTVGALRAKGIPGFAYWTLLQPVHRLVFRALARHRTQNW